MIISGQIIEACGKQNVGYFVFVFFADDGHAQYYAVMWGVWDELGVA